MSKGIGRELLAEFLGTFVLIVFGVGVVALMVGVFIIYNSVSISVV